MTGLRDWAVVALISLVIATAAFVAHRNHAAIAERELLARRVRDAVIRNPQVAATPIPDVEAAALLGEATPSPRYGFLRRRGVLAGLDRRSALGGPGAPRTDKLLYDAATRYERAGPLVEQLPDGRVLAADGAPGRIAVVVTAPATPAPYPWARMLVAFLVGSVLAAAGAMLAKRLPRTSGGAARAAGITSGGLAVATAVHAWSPSAAVAIAAVGLVAGLLAWRGATDRFARGVSLHRTALAFVGPAAIAMSGLVMIPFAVGLVLGFFDHHLGTWTFVGIDNFVTILSGGGHALSDPLNFWFMLAVTIVWTVVNVALHVTIGVALALLLQKSWLAGRGVFRVLLILPWAVPNYITALMWRGMYEGDYGAINSILAFFGLDRVSWFSSWLTAFTANVSTNTWLGFPFMMVVALGALQSIPKDLYEAVEIDGASRWQRFWHVTVPHLRPALGPAIALGVMWTFNMFNVIFLVSGGMPGGSTDILVTDAYRWAFARGERYGMAAAYGTIIFFILLLWTTFGTKTFRREAHP